MESIRQQQVGVCDVFHGAHANRLPSARCSHRCGVRPGVSRIGARLPGAPLSLDERNPFAASAPPPPSKVAPYSPRRLAPAELEAGAILGRAGEHIQTFAVISLIVVGILFALHAVLKVGSFALGIAGALVVIALGLPEDVMRVVEVSVGMFEAFLSSMILLGGYRAFLTGARGGTPTPGQIFGERGALLSYLAASLLLLPLALVVWLPAVGAGVALYYRQTTWEVVLAVGIGNLVVAMAVGAVVATFTQFLGLIVVDQDLGPVEALKECWRITEGHRVLAFALVVGLGFVTGVVSFFSCGFGWCIGEVFAAWVRLVTYRALLLVNGRSPLAVDGPI
jgi:hypothetical protein